MTWGRQTFPRKEKVKVPKMVIRPERVHGKSDAIHAAESATRKTARREQVKVKAPAAASHQEKVQARIQPQEAKANRHLPPDAKSASIGTKANACAATNANTIIPP